MPGRLIVTGKTSKYKHILWPNRPLSEDSAITSLIEDIDILDERIKDLYEAFAASKLNPENTPDWKDAFSLFERVRSSGASAAGVRSMSELGELLKKGAALNDASFWEEYRKLVAQKKELCTVENKRIAASERNLNEHEQIKLQQLMVAALIAMLGRLGFNDRDQMQAVQTFLHELNSLRQDAGRNHQLAPISR